jgi:hypothetical protein
MLDLLAQRIVNPQIIDSIINFSGEGYLNRLVPILIYLGFIICIVAFILLFLFGGVQWIMAGGNKQNLENARNKIVNAVTGLLILLLLWLVLQVVNLIFGINIGGLGTPGAGPTPTPATEDGRCIAAGGTWRMFPNSCADICGAEFCLTVNTMGCDCPVGCWTDPVFVAPSPTPATEQLRCIAAGGSWVSFDTPCADICGAPPITMCPPSPTMGCDCNPGCWTDPVCKLVSEGSPCSNSSQCAAGFCSTGMDVDGDGFTTEGAGICAAGAPDCNDNNPLVYPGQTQYFQDPIPPTGNNFNYDCADGDGDGDPNDKWPTWNCLSTITDTNICQDGTPLANSFGHQGWSDSIPSCGQSIINPPWGPPTWIDCVSGTRMCSFGPGGGWFQMDCNAPDLCLTGDDPTTGVPFRSYHSEEIGFYPWMFGPSDFTRMPCK